MFYILLFLATLGPAVCVAACRGRPAEKYLPYGMILAALIAFCFGLADALPAGAVAVGFFVIACWVAALWRTARKKTWRTLLVNVCTPGMLLYAALFVCVVWMQKGRSVWVQDDYNYWFRALRAMWADHKLPLYPGTDFMFHQSYPPGLPVLEYLVSMLRGNFLQGDAFGIYGILCISMGIPLCAGLAWRRAWLLPAAALGLLLLPVAFGAFSDSYYFAYEALIGDSALGMTFGLALLIALTEKPGLGRAARLSLLCAMLTLTKPSGFSMALIALAAAGIMGFARERKGRGLVLLALAACLPALVHMLWRWKLAQQSIDTLYAVHFDARVLMNLLLRRDASYRAEVLSAFIRFPWQLAVNNPQSAFALGTLSHWKLAVLLALPIPGLLILSGPKARARRIAGAASILAGYGAYALGMLMVYLFSAPRLGGRGPLPSFDRYMSTYYQAALVCMLGWAMRASLFGQKERIMARATLAYLLVLMTVTVPAPEIIGRMVRHGRGYPAGSLDVFSQHAAPIRERIPTDAVVGIYYLQHGHHGANMQAAAYPLRMVRKRALPPPTFEDEGWQEVRSFDYVYIAQADEDFVSTYGFLFEGGFGASQKNWATGRLYQVNVDGDDRLSFSLINLTSSENLIE